MKNCARINLALASVLGLAAWSGCRGLSTQDERAARQELASVAQTYRPDGWRPELPELKPDAGFSNYLTFALLNQPKIEASYNDWASSVERITVERSLPDPRLTFESDIADIVMTVMPGFMQEFPGPGKLKAASHVASAGSHAKYFSFESSVLQTALDLKRSYYTLHFLDDKIRINRRMLGLLGDLEKIARAQNEVGKVTLQDVYRAQIENDQLKREIANLVDSRKPMLAQFKAALGLRHDQADPPVPAALETIALDLNADDLLATGFARNPRLKAMEAEVGMAEAEIAMAAKSKVPDFSLGLEADAKAAPVMFRPQGSMTL
ncbi:MAG TPA: TolC family protein, partial [Candidatus Eisenbacteria bacterium]|nr:TolC family protein [Candidatus Eisenbacteria bacterium]